MGIDSSSDNTTAKKRIKPKKEWFLMALPFIVFFVIGAGFSWGFVVTPLLKIKASENWPKKNCVISKSRVKEIRSRTDGKTRITYSIDMTFKYKFKGIDYISEKYNFITHSDGNYNSKSKIVNRYPPGKSASCYVNPENPSEAVISREFDALWGPGILSSIAMLIGIAGIIGVIVEKLKSLETDN